MKLSSRRQRRNERENHQPVLKQSKKGMGERKKPNEVMDWMEEKSKNLKEMKIKSIGIKGC